MLAENLGANLRSAREELGLSQEQVAEKVGITQPAYSFIESGFKTPSVATLVRLSNLLNVSMDELTKSESKEK